MARDRAGQLRVPLSGEPCRRSFAMGEVARRIVRRQRLVGVVEQGRGLDQPPVDRDPAGIDPRRQPAGDLGHGARVPHEPGRGIQGEQEGGGIHPPRDRHRPDGTRRSRPAAGRTAVAAVPRAGSRSGIRAPCRDRAAEGRRRGARIRGPRRDGTPALGPHRHPGRVEGGHDGPVEVRPEDPGAGRREPVEGRTRRVAVRVAGPGRGDRHLRPGRIDEGLRRGRPAAVVGHLEEVEPRQLVGQQRRVDLLLDVARSAGSGTRRPPEQHDRDVVDARPAVRRHRPGPAADRPQDAQVDLVDGQAVARARPIRTGADASSAGRARRRSRDPDRACPARRPDGRDSDRAAGPGRRRGPRADA